MVHVYCGDGKGKTTAAAGLAVRAAGAGKTVVFSQFMKGKESSEIGALRAIPGITVVREDYDLPFYCQMTAEQKMECTRIHDRIFARCRDLAAYGQCDLLVLDEVAYAYRYALMQREPLEELILSAGDMEIVITGREPDDFFLAHADYITEMKKIRHPFDAGIAAREGIEL